MTTPCGTDLFVFFEDDEVDTRFSQTGPHRKSRWTRANDSNVRLLHLVLPFGLDYHNDDPTGSARWHVAVPVHLPCGKAENTRI